MTWNNNEVSIHVMYRNASDIHCKHYGFTPLWRRSECRSRSRRVVNCCWQMSHVNQVPSLC